jgi:hypothetical protein
VHRRDTAALVGDTVWARRATNVGPSLRGTGTAEVVDLSWVRQNVSLVHLLRSGQWRTIPSPLPENWVERLACKVPGVTTSDARRILTSAFAAAPQLSKGKYLEPVSSDERAWVGQHIGTVRDLSSGRSMGIPASPTRAWVSAFQSAVGGTVAEISAILAIILKAIETEPDMALTPSS